MALTIKPEYFEKWIAGGWQFQQALPGNLGFWRAPGPLINSFRQQVGNIVSWRKANPVIAVKLKLSLDWDTVAGELIAQNVARLLKLPRGDYYLYDDEQASSAPPDAQKKSLWEFVKSKGAAVGETLAAVANGETVLQEWLGEGGVPVKGMLAEFRAGVCTGCPKNSKNHWTLHFTKPLAMAITKTIELKHKAKLSTARDGELGVCLPCKCVLELKVHVPLEHIKASTKPEVEKELWENCWIRKEQP